jgi:hypothetical protein
MIKVGKTSNFEKRWKDLAHWQFDENKSFALYCTTAKAQKRIEDTLKIFFQLYPALDGNIPHQDGYTECFDERITDDLKDFFQYFSKRYSHEYSYIKNIKPFIGFPTIFTGMKKDKVVDYLVKNSMVHTNNDGSLDIYFGFKEDLSNF